jgi:hypothetical protein
MKFLYDNILWQPLCVITYSTENPYKLFDDALQDYRKTRLGEFLGVTGEWIKFDLSGYSTGYNTSVD